MQKKLKEKLDKVQKQTDNTEPKEGQKATPELQDLMFSKHIQITLRVAAITLGSILIFSGGGFLLDMQIGTKPLFLILGLVVSFPLSQYIIYRTFRSVTTNIQNKYK